MLAVVNVGEDDLDAIAEKEALIAAEFNNAGDNVEVIGMCVQLEAEAAAIVDPDERAEILEGFGLGEGALFRMVRSAYHLLGLRTYLHDRREGEPGLDVLRGLDRAGVRRPDPHRLPARLHQGRGDPVGRAARARLVASGKEAGKIRVEGKDYVAQDGDVMEFRFNV